MQHLRRRQNLAVHECSTDPVRARGWCNKHWQRWYKNGDPLRVKRIFNDDEARFWSKVNKQPGDGCWLWTGTIERTGYGAFSLAVFDGEPRKIVKAHRWSYLHFVGEIPEDRPKLDHLCHGADSTCPGGWSCLHRRCVRWHHLDPVTDLVNHQRGRYGGLTRDDVIVLRERWLAGEAAVDLAAEVDLKLGTLYARFKRLRRSERAGRLTPWRTP